MNDKVNYYCIYCKSGDETAIEEELKRQGHYVIHCSTERIVEIEGKKKTEVRRMLPGYIIFYTSEKPLWEKITGIKNVYKILSYDDGTRELKEGDLKFIKWIKNNEGKIGISKVKREGMKITVIDGPLKRYEGKIVKINKRQNVVKVHIDDSGVINNIWLGIKYID
jgi:transcription antitermination factor NusG